MTDESYEKYDWPADTPSDDAPAEEMVPGAEVPPWWRSPFVIVCIVVALLVLAVVALAVRTVWRFLRPAQTAAPYMSTPRESIMFTPQERPYAGPIYYLHFYDGNYRQLADETIPVACDLNDPSLSAQLAALVPQLVAAVERRDGQRHFGPSAIVLVNARGVRVYEWNEGAHVSWRH